MNTASIRSAVEQQRSRLTYALVTPARDEELNLRRLAACLAAQTVLPLVWIVVDDGSTDGTAAFMTQFALVHSWVRLIAAPPAGGSLIDGRLSGRDVVAFEAGLDVLPEQADLVLKLDADVSLEPDFFDRMIAEFERDPRLGIASGACYEREGDEWVERRTTGKHARGATRAYRWECLQQVRPLEPRLGWDGIDEVRAVLNGWETRTITTIPFFHHRRMGERDGMKRAFRDQGSTAYYMGYRPSYIVSRALYKATTSPTALAMLAGYGKAAIRRDPKLKDREVQAYIRDRQRLRELPRRAAEAMSRTKI